MRSEYESAKIETAIRFARVISRHGNSTQEERRAAFREAQAEGISTFDSLRTCILLGVSNGNGSLVSLWLRDQ